MSERIAFTGGGTGGHVYPALAVVEEMKTLGADGVFWIGSARGMERGILRDRGIRYYGVPAGKLRRYLSVRNLFDLVKIGFGFLASLVVLLRERPAVLFSKGGYVSVPPVAAAWLLRIPVLTHESDLDPGLATRINARFAETVLTSFPETAGHLPPEVRSRVVCAGNPVRPALITGRAEEGRRRVGCAEDWPLVLVLGGSLGSQTINRLVEGSLPELTARCFLVHQMGGAHFKPSTVKGYHTAAFLHEELPDLLAAADLVICRAGANTLWELAALGKPALLIPLGRAASRGDQIGNARYMERHGAAAVLLEEEATPGRLAAIVRGLLQDPSALGQMARQASSLGRPEAAREIARILLERSRQVHAPPAV
jgi:UDP-N-acetylglucosamine--N-acetylmuramyl-(pentapeptide) pyrophosphoryl-undecaprenol N-acetylglucosamine transferase